MSEQIFVAVDRDNIGIEAQVETRAGKAWDLLLTLIDNDNDRDIAINLEGRDILRLRDALNKHFPKEQA